MRIIVLAMLLALNAFLRRHLGAAKVLLAIVFGALAAAMLIQRLAGPA